MRCAGARKLMWRAQDSALSEIDSDALNGHLSQCAECRAERDAVTQTMGLLDAWQTPQPTRNYASFLQRVQRDQVRRQKPAFRRWLAGGLATASIVCGIGLGFLTADPVEQPVPSENELASAIGLHTFGDMIESAIHYDPDSTVGVQNGKEIDL